MSHRIGIVLVIAGIILVVGLWIGNLADRSNSNTEQSIFIGSRDSSAPNQLPMALSGYGNTFDADPTSDSKLLTTRNSNVSGLIFTKGEQNSRPQEG